MLHDIIEKAKTFSLVYTVFFFFTNQMTRVKDGLMKQMKNHLMEMKEMVELYAIYIRHTYVQAEILVALLLLDADIMLYDTSYRMA